MKGDKKRLKNSFRKGYTPHYKGFKLEESSHTPENVVPFQRLTVSEADDVFNQFNQAFSVPVSSPDASGTADHADLRLIRPKADVPLEVTKLAETPYTYRNEADSYRVLHVMKVMAMYNECIDEHAEQFPHCKGKSTLYWDLSKEQQWGLCWIEQMFCAKCSYKSKPYPLYKEVDGESTKGRKAANINRGIHVGLSQTPIGPTSLRRVLMSVHVPPPSKAGLQKRANKVCSNICEVNKLDMQRRREDLKKINKLRNEPEHVINIECDGAYNNKLYSGVGRTLMQPTTQCNYVVAETRDKLLL